MEEQQLARAGNYDDIPIYALADGSRGGADKHHVHVQAVASTVWTIDHNLNKNPAPVFLDTAGNVIEGAHLSYPTLNRMIAEWSSPFSGEAYLN